MSAPTIITGAQVVQVFIDAGVLASFSVADRSYCCFTQDFIEREFSEGLAKFQFDLGIKDFVEEENDCDDFAADAGFYGRLVHRRAADRPKRVGLACGKFYYTQADGENHAIDWFIVSTPAGLRLVHYEPQRRAVFGLSVAETSSCFFWATP